MENALFIVKDKSNRTRQVLKKEFKTKKDLKKVIEFLYDNDFQNEESEEQELNELKEKYKHLPIKWSDKKPNLNDLAGIWKDYDIDIIKLREKAWHRT